MTFILALVLCLMLSNQVISHAVQYETVLQMLEPFIWTYGDAASVMLSSLLLVLLFADMPFVSQETPYWLVRTKRSIWLAGQVIYVILATAIYNLFLLVILGIMDGFLLNPSVFQRIFHFTGNLEYRANVLCGWLSPLNHATFPMHNFGYDYLPRIQVSVGVFLILIVMLVFLAGRRMRSYNFSFVQVDE